MIAPQRGDEGRAVIYARQSPQRTTEVGYVTSWNDHYVFVRYGVPGTGGTATERTDLEWFDDVPAGTNFLDRTTLPATWSIVGQSR